MEKKKKKEVEEKKFGEKLVRIRVLVYTHISRIQNCFYKQGLIDITFHSLLHLPLVFLIANMSLNISD